MRRDLHIEAFLIVLGLVAVLVVAGIAKWLDAKTIDRLEAAGDSLRLHAFDVLLQRCARC